MEKIKYFPASEFVCNGVNCYDKMNKPFLKKLSVARGVAGTPFNITSSWRSQEHNAKVGGSKNSSHLKGCAVDISVNTSVDRFKILDALLDVGFNRIGIASNFIHVDDDAEKISGVIWTY